MSPVEMGQWAKARGELHTAISLKYGGSGGLDTRLGTGETLT